MAHGLRKRTALVDELDSFLAPTWNSPQQPVVPASGDPMPLFSSVLWDHKYTAQPSYGHTDMERAICATQISLHHEFE